MYFSYDKSRGIFVDKPFQRVMIPYMMPDTADCPINFSIHLTEWEPGSKVDEHLHEGAMEAMYCVSGHGTASVGDKVYDLVPNSMIAAAPGELHCIENTGSETLQCICIFSPPTTAKGLRDRAQGAVDAAKKADET